MNMPPLVPRISLQHFRTSIQLNAHLLALRNANVRTSVRYASGKSIGDKRERDQPKKKRKSRTVFKQYDLKNAEQFSLCDAMRYDVGLYRGCIGSLSAEISILATSRRSRSEDLLTHPNTISP